MVTGDVSRATHLFFFSIGSEFNGTSTQKGSSPVSISAYMRAFDLSVVNKSPGKN